MRALDTDEGLIEAALDIAQEHRKKMIQLFDAVEREDWAQVKVVVEGLRGNEESNRIDPGVNRSSGGIGSR